MNTRINKAYFLIPIFYSLIIVSLLYLQFSGSRSFSAEIEGISIKGRTTAGSPGKERALKNLHVYCGGIDFSFDEENPVIIYTQDGLNHLAHPVDYRVTATGIDVLLAKKTSVSFYVQQNNKQQINIEVTSEDPLSVRYISLPFSSEGYTVSARDGVPVITLENEEDSSRYFITMPENCEFDAENTKLNMYPSDTTFGLLAVEKAPENILDAFAFWFNGNSELTTEEDLQKEIKDYLDKSVSAMRNSRYNSTGGTWESKTGLDVFSETALMASMSESVNTSGYIRTRETLENSAARNSDDLTILSAPLFGNIVNAGWSYDKKISDLVNPLERKSGIADYSIFTQPELINVIMTENSERLLANIRKMSEELAENSIDVATAVSILDFYNRMKAEAPDKAEDLQGFETLLSDIILPSVAMAGKGLFIMTDESSSEVSVSLTAGLNMIHNQSAEEAENVRTLGRELVKSVLDLSDSRGFLPERVIKNEDDEALTDGVINPEDVYSLLSTNTYYPEEDFFLTELGEPVSVYNAADNFEIEKTETGYKISMDYPAGAIHSFVIRNFKPFYSMNLLGYQWNADHRFMTYFSGWWYDRSNQCLYVKIRHRFTTEEILIETNRPAVQPAPATETSTETAAPAAETVQ